MVSATMKQVLCAALMVSSVSWAQAPETRPSVDATAAEAATMPKDEKPVCSWQRATGSNIPRKVCLSASESAALRQQNQQTLRDAHLSTPVSHQ